ncbi:serine protease 7-like [Anopheles marshallii]|uniref:serine protease 7-like n=1 Tax=Anopheles marshallii TaxID=1521116 RepID=UPI00237BB92B|nr:serine protease 7-like [Anopheles marshallii]
MTTHGLIARRRLVVQVGLNRISAADNRAQNHKAFELIVHPEYSVNSIRHDVALIVLETDITYTDYIQPVCLWNRDDDLNAIVGTWGTVVGFGIDETDEVSDTLREASIPVVNHITCIESNRELFGSQLTSNMFCAGNRDGIGACNGDSGGGLFFNYSDTWFIRGVVSFTKPRQYGNYCGTNEYTVFTDVAKYLSWIEQQMGGKDGQSIATGIANGHKIGLLPMSTCGPNPYASREELSKPVLLGYPWVGLVECTAKETFEKRIVCEATLISDLSSVLMGEYDINSPKDCLNVDGQMVCSPPVQTLRIESVIAHTGFNRPIRFADDIALIRLRDRADTSWSNVKPICLPVTSELRSLKPTHVTLTTWELLTGGNLLERTLRETIDTTECEKLLRDNFLIARLTARQICIKPHLNSDCKLSLSGAPLQVVQKVQGESRYVLYGVASVGPNNCTDPIPDIYTNIASYVDWILENIQE